MKALLILLLSALIPAAASAHCPVSYVLTGPGGIAFRLNLGGVITDGVLPGGTLSQLGPMTTWADTRREGQTTGTLHVNANFTDGTHYAVCPEVTINVSGPPQCSEDGEPGAVGHPLCIPYFTAVQTAPGVFSCASTCQPGAYPAPQSYTPAPSSPPTLSALSPASAKAGSGALAVSVSGSGFLGSSVVQWNGAPLSTTFLNGGLLVALVPASLSAAPGTAGVTVTKPGSVSAPMGFTLTP